MQSIAGAYCREDAPTFGYSYVPSQRFAEAKARSQTCPSLSDGGHVLCEAMHYSQYPGKDTTPLRPPITSPLYGFSLPPKPYRYRWGGCDFSKHGVRAFECVEGHGERGGTSGSGIGPGHPRRERGDRPTSTICSLKRAFALFSGLEWRSSDR